MTGGIGRLWMPWKGKRFDPEANPRAADEVRGRFGIAPDKVVALIVALLSTEWWLRRRAGLR